MNKILKISVIAVMAALFISACSTSPKTQVTQIGDEQLSKEQILAEMKKLDDSQKEIESKKGVTGTNVASVLFWWPGIAYTYYDASEATKLIEQRRSHLSNIYNRKFADNAATSSKV